MKDYMFAPGRTAYDRSVRDLFRNRPETELIITCQHPLDNTRRKRIKELGEMFLTVNFDSDIDRPLRKIFIGTHGNDSGWMQIQFGDIDLDGDGRSESNTTYEVLEEAATTNAFEFSDSSRDVNTKVHIRGCLIGQDFALPFLSKLKEVLGNEVPVSAPKHYHVTYRIRNAGIIEFFAYQFELHVLEPFRAGDGETAREHLIDAFKAASFFYIDSAGGSSVEDEFWDRWTPRNVGLGKRTVRYPVNIEPPIQPRRGSTITSLVIEYPEAFRALRENYRFTVTEVESDPGSQAARIEVVKNVIRANAHFQDPPTHPFPIHARWEFDTVEDFLDGFNWRATYNRNRKKLYGVGTRYTYTLIVPITSNPDPSDTTKNHLIYNFYPQTNNPVAPITLIDDNDENLFATV